LDGYSWGVAPAAGVDAGATSVSAFGVLLKWGRLDGERSSANIESRYDVDTAKDLELHDPFQDRFRAQIVRHLFSQTGREDRSLIVVMPEGSSGNESRENLGRF
jgi:hypothetical protein